MKKTIVVNLNKQKIKLYEDDNLITSLEEVYFGKNGCTYHKKEGDGKTPLGRFRLGFAFGINELEAKYPYYQINDNCYWVDDINSKYYNNWVEITHLNKKYQYSYQKTIKEKEFISAEKLASYPINYELAFVIEYNTLDIKKNVGSAIFLHIKNKDYTEGCISTNKENIEYIWKWVNKDYQKDNVEIIISR